MPLTEGLDQKALATNPNRLTIMKIAEMGTAGVPDDVIVEEIKQTKSVYHLTSELIAYLKNNNVSNKVIDYMMSMSRK